ncbi:MAG: peptide ABC transporter ATP-binding protein [Chloroflexi bacterium]|nr:peptide ABC transporter ATP-binding protein [Chloroflexota bacterium]
MSFININKISKSYGKIKVISDLSLSLNKGEKLSIIGPSGSGKTTFLKLLMGIESVNTGKILIDGSSIKKRKVNNNSSKIGMVFQGHHLFPHLSVMRNVSISLELVKRINKKLAEEKSIKALSAVQIPENLYKKLPNQLSGGEKQRVAIARMLVLDPEIMLFDEPTASLDPELIDEVLRIINKLTDYKKTMIFVTHEIKFAEKISTKMAYLDSGELLEIDTPQNIINKPKSEKLKTFLSKIL